jgi:hypothetical protein
MIITKLLIFILRFIEKIINVLTVKAATIIKKQKKYPMIGMILITQEESGVAK